MDELTRPLQGLAMLGPPGEGGDRDAWPEPGDAGNGPVRRRPRRLGLSLATLGRPGEAGDRDVWPEPGDAGTAR